MEQEPGGHKPRASILVYLWSLILGIGTAIGIGIGAAINSIGAGVAIGVGVSVVVGLVLYRRFNRNSSDD